jgi:hypothetical protein
VLDEGEPRGPEKLRGLAAGDRPASVELEDDHLPRRRLHRLVGLVQESREGLVDLDPDGAHGVRLR